VHEMKPRIVAAIFVIIGLLVILFICSIHGRPSPEEICDRLVLQSSHVFYTSLKGVYLSKGSEPVIACRLVMNPNEMAKLFKAEEYKAVSSDDFSRVCKWFRIALDRLDGKDVAVETNRLSCGNINGAQVLLMFREKDVIMVRIRY